MSGCRMEASDDGLSLCNGKACAGNRRAKREGTGAHSLATSAMTSHREQWRGIDQQADLPASAAALKLAILSHRLYLACAALGSTRTGRHELITPETNGHRDRIRNALR